MRSGKTHSVSALSSLYLQRVSVHIHNVLTLHMQPEIVNTVFEVLKPRSLRLARSGDTALVVCAMTRYLGGGILFALSQITVPDTLVGIGATDRACH